MTAATTTTVASPRTHKRKREALRKKLRDAGLDPAFIDQRVEVMKARQEAERAGDHDEVERLRAIEQEMTHEITYRTTRLDDTGYKPTSIDPLERGPARVTRRTARAARRSTATTAYELAQREVANQ